MDLQYGLRQGCKFSFVHVTHMTKSARGRGKSRSEGTGRGGVGNDLSGLIQNGAQWHFGVIQISAHLGPNESKQPLFEPTCMLWHILHRLFQHPPTPHHPHSSPFHFLNASQTAAGSYALANSQFAGMINSLLWYIYKTQSRGKLYVRALGIGSGINNLFN